MEKTVEVSVVVPLYNEQDNIDQLHSELVSTFGKSNFSYEIIYVNDGSTDHSYQKLRDLSGCTVINLRRSFGQTAALMAGIDNSNGNIICTLDGDLQNDPHDLLPMLEVLKKDSVDMVIGWRKKRFDHMDKRIPSFLAYLLRQLLLHDGIHDAGCGVKVFKKEVMGELELYGEMHRFFASLVKANGFLVSEYVVNHRPRLMGRSKYTWKRGLKGFLDMIAVWFWGNYSARPLHLLGGIGLAVIMLSCAILFFSLTHVFVDFGLLDSEQWIIFAFLTFILGIQLIVSGLVADIAVRGYFAAGKKKGYLIGEILNNN